MKFKILRSFTNIPINHTDICYLQWDNWNDFNYYTLFGLSYVDFKNTVHKIGGVRIGFFGQKEKDRVFKPGHEFSSLGQKYFSLGVSADYYDNLNGIGHEIRDEILIKLNDLAKDLDKFNLAIEEDVTQTSLLRDISLSTVKGQFHRISKGGAKLTGFRFQFKSDKIEKNALKYELDFTVIPESLPPTNIHVLIGRNGVGKTYLLDCMVKNLLSISINSCRGYRFIMLEEEHPFLLDNYPDNETDDFPFANIITVAFSAFDQTEPLNKDNLKTYLMPYHYIGLKKFSFGEIKVKSASDLTNEFIQYLQMCKASKLKERWKGAIYNLNSDPNFSELEISSMIDIDEQGFTSNIKNKFLQLSSGHKIVLITITILVVTLQEKSLVFIDEPEAHLHPPLLSAFIRSLSELLIYSNAVAIIATHSPVVLQEVPKSCVWRLKRSAEDCIAERLDIETFGENVGRLTHEIFGLQVTKSGFYDILKDVAKDCQTYEEALREFENELGSEAKALLRLLYLNRDQ